MRLLHTTGRWCGLASSLGGELLTRGFTTRGFTYKGISDDVLVVASLGRLGVDACDITTSRPYETRQSTR